MDLRNNGDTTNFIEKIEIGFNLINHMLISFISIYMTYACLHLNLQKTALHAWLCTLGYNLLMAEAMMTFFKGNILLSTMQRKTKTTTHWILQAFGGTLGIAGSIVKIVDKTTHFTTSHGIAGLVAMILSAISMISGICTLYNIEIKRFITPLINKFFHNVIGLSAFLAGMSALYYGYDTGFFKRKVEPDFADMMRTFTIITIILSSWGSLRSLYGKIQSFRAY
ncbi:transmembrane reductase CYB561D2-like [Condylostylus longicornis]|uniref:transmembrane reductase CYB561D2-like n=1 Tax=Condylostylus longicornis TaxID=2530218 RepID=UPI00244DC7A9|nr:transmembrane reductase CYB561D2-like [Condylostylus longicornis]